ncbi:hypothetical protein [Streptomyces sp. NPDC056921]|uniref:hypothetical protein n=1 Tax=Streptomyces sp. NPDC056921 TaxID=3345966 RepID=UPI00363FC4ED
MRRAHAGQATAQEQYLLARHATARTPPPVPGDEGEVRVQERDAAATETEGLDGLDQDVEDAAGDNEALGGLAAPVAGYGLYDTQEEADKW